MTDIKRHTNIWVAGFLDLPIVPVEGVAQTDYCPICGPTTVPYSSAAGSLERARVFPVG